MALMEYEVQINPSSSTGAAQKRPGNDHQMSVQSLKYWYSSGLVRKELRVGRARSVNSCIQVDARNIKFNQEISYSLFCTYSKLCFSYH